MYESSWTSFAFAWHCKLKISHGVYATSICHSQFSDGIPITETNNFKDVDRCIYIYVRVIKISLILVTRQIIDNFPLWRLAFHKLAENKFQSEMWQGNAINAIACVLVCFLWFFHSIWLIRINVCFPFEHVNYDLLNFYHL